MAKAAMDEAVRNLVAVGADPARIAVLDNFCWGNTDRAEELGALVRSAQGCHDLSISWMMPFISGKDSLRNEYNHDGTRVVIPPTLLISAMGIMPSKTQVVTMDLKGSGNRIFLVGKSHNALAGSHWQHLHGLDALDTGSIPHVDDQAALSTFHSLHQAIREGFVKSCHDVSDGGVAVALAEMAIAGNIGMDISGLAKACAGLDDTATLFGESPSRFLVEVEPSRVEDFLATMAGVDCHEIGTTIRETRLRIAGHDGSWIVWSPIADLRKAFHAAPEI
jgi:phosphoribosylformylglycinamidine synthase